MNENSRVSYEDIKALLKRKKSQAGVIAFLSAVIIFGALIYITFWAGLNLGLSGSTTAICIIVLVYLAFAVSAYFFVHQYIFKWFVEEIETNHYKEKDYVEMTERAYMEIK